VAGSAPDALGINVARFASSPFGRNTAESRFGILSDSGVMPINRKVADAAVRDPKGKTLMLVEQSGYWQDKTVDPPNDYDPRSAWPNGAFMGSTADYGQVSPLVAGINGEGSARAWNVTTIRYAINDPGILGRNGIVVDPAPPRPAKKGDPTPAAPPYPADGYGPGHNHGIVSAHPGGAHVLMADGASRFLNEKIDRVLLIQISTRDDGAEFDDGLLEGEEQK
jgi:prepilin-type processing-associated H-X9-DG protein